jgi:hypothetical protein
MGGAIQIALFVLLCTRGQDLLFELFTAPGSDQEIIHDPVEVFTGGPDYNGLNTSNCRKSLNCRPPVAVVCLEPTCKAPALDKVDLFSSPRRTAS